MQAICLGSLKHGLKFSTPRFRLEHKSRGRGSGPKGNGSRVSILSRMVRSLLLIIVFVRFFNLFLLLTRGTVSQVPTNAAHFWVLGPRGGPRARHRPHQCPGKQRFLPGGIARAKFCYDKIGSKKTYQIFPFSWCFYQFLTILQSEPVNSKPQE